MVEGYDEFFAGNGIERVALVSSDGKNLAVKSRVDVPGVDVPAMDDVDEASAWARGAD